MGITLSGLHLGAFGLDLDILLYPNPKLLLHTGKQQGPRVWYQCPALAYIVETPDGRVLFDTGPSPTWSEEWPAELTWLFDASRITPEVTLERQLEQLGLGPEDFTYVVQGHLHMDHAGGLRLFERAGTQILLHEDELKHVQQRDVDFDGFVRRDWDLLTGRKRPTLVYGEQELSKDVRIVSLPGHTPGSIGLLVRLERTGWVLLPGDALATHESYGPPAVGNLGWNHPQVMESIEKIRGIAREHSALIFPGHDTIGVKQHGPGHDHGEHTEFRAIQFRQFSPGYVYE